jgi:hypothetical protein
MNIIPTAKEMNSYLCALVNLLCKKALISPESKNYLDRANTQLMKFKSSRTWEYVILPSEPIQFVPTDDKKLGKIVPKVYLDVAVAPPKRDDLPPFERLDTKIEIFDLAGNLHSRWHIDLANLKEEGFYQAGPLFHLQSGGHKPQANRKQELKLSRPRWAMPPMELILTCEMILANFYPKQWETIRKEKRWLKLIHIAQLMCYSAYFQRLHHCLFEGQLTLKSQSESVLTALWANEWG